MLRKFASKFKRINKERIKSLLFLGIFLFLLILLWEYLSLYVSDIKFPELVDTVKLFFISFSYDTIIESSGGGDRGYSYHIFISAFNFFSASPANSKFGSLSRAYY